MFGLNQCTILFIADLIWQISGPKVDLVNFLEP